MGGAGRERRLDLVEPVDLDDESARIPAALARSTASATPPHTAT